MNSYPQMLHDTEAEHTLLSILVNPLTKKEQYDTIEGYIKQVEQFVPFFIEDDCKAVWNIIKYIRVNTNEHPSTFSLIEYQKFHPECSPDYLTDHPTAKGTFNIGSFSTSVDVYFATNYIRILAECARRRFFQKLGADLQNDAVDPGATFTRIDSINRFKTALESNYFVSTDKIEELVTSCLVDFTKPAEKPFFWLSYKGQGFCAKGGISAFSGKAKKGKTQFLMLLLATLVSGKSVCGLTANAKPAKVAWVDTEQKEYSIQGNFQRVMRTLGITGNPSDFGIDVYQMRYRTIQERKDVVQWLANQKEKPDFIVIDGLLDLCFNMNDMAESNLLIQLLMQLTENDITVLVVLHENEGQDSEKMSGALGSNLERKYDDKFSISKKDDTFTVKHTARNAMSIPKFEFHIANNAYEEGAAEASNSDNTKLDVAFEAAKDALQYGNLRYGELASKIALRIEQSPATAKNRINDMLSLGWIKRSDDGLFSLS